MNFEGRPEVRFRRRIEQWLSPCVMLLDRIWLGNCMKQKVIFWGWKREITRPASRNVFTGIRYMLSGWNLQYMISWWKGRLVDNCMSYICKNIKVPQWCQGQVIQKFIEMFHSDTVWNIEWFTSMWCIISKTRGNLSLAVVAFSCCCVRTEEGNIEWRLNDPSWVRVSPAIIVSYVVTATRGQ